VTLDDLELYAWIGDDEFSSDGLSIKRALAPTGCVPLVALRRDKVEQMKPRMEAEARLMGRKIHLVRFVPAEVVAQTEAGA
jgi:hypothetical protein